VFILAIPLSVAAYDNSATSYQVLPEVIWAPASGGGIWATEVQIIDKTGGSQVSVLFFSGGGVSRGPFPLWTGPADLTSIKILNILEYAQTNLDPGFTYYGRVGAMWFITQDSSHKIWVSSRTINGNYSKTFPGLNNYDSNTIVLGRNMMITNLVQNSTYRSTVGVHNISGSSITIRFMLIDSDKATIGSFFEKTIGPYDFQAFFPFTEAGVGSGTYENVWLFMWPQSGSGRVMCFGATGNNHTNDPAAHIAVQYQ